MISTLIPLNFLLSLLLYSSFINASPQTPNINSLIDPFPTQILSAYNGRQQHNNAGSRWSHAARVNDNEEVSKHFQSLLMGTTTQSKFKCLFIIRNVKKSVFILQISV